MMAHVDKFTFSYLGRQRRKEVLNCEKLFQLCYGGRGRGGMARIITQGGGKGTWMPIHTLCHVTHVVPYSQRDSHPYATHAITYSAP